jgi:hypothetical protein
LWKILKLLFFTALGVEPRALNPLSTWSYTPSLNHSFLLKAACMAAENTAERQTPRFQTPALSRQLSELAPY